MDHSFSLSDPTVRRGGGMHETQAYTLGPDPTTFEVCWLNPFVDPTNILQGEEVSNR